MKKCSRKKLVQGVCDVWTEWVVVEEKLNGMG